MDFGKALPYDINITSSANNGFIVRVGCCEVVFSSRSEVIAALTEYITEPEKVEQQYNKVNGPMNEEEPAPDSGGRSYHAGVERRPSGNRLRGPSVS